MQKNNSYTAAFKYAYAYFVMMFTLFASTVIFYRSVEIIQNLYYTSWHRVCVDMVKHFSEAFSRVGY